MNYVIHQGDCIENLRNMPDASVYTCVTSPPYFGLRDYRCEGQIGREGNPDEFITRMVDVFREVRRVLRCDGTLWLNLGDSYSGSGRGAWNCGDEHKGLVKESYRPRVTPTPRAFGLPSKNLIGIPWRVALALQADGWYLRQDIIWHKPGPMPESVKDRCSKAHEYIFLLSKSARYHFDYKAIQEPAIYGAKGSDFHTGKTGEHQLGRASSKPRESKVRGEFNGKTNTLPGRESFRAIREMRNKRSVWTVSTKPYKGAHFATFPPKLIEPCVLAGCPAGETVLDPFTGSGTTGEVAVKHGRNFVGIELNPEYIQLAETRISRAVPALFQEAMQ